MWLLAFVLVSGACLTMTRCRWHPDSAVIFEGWRWPASLHLRQPTRVLVLLKNKLQLTASLLNCFVFSEDPPGPTGSVKPDLEQKDRSRGAIAHPHAPRRLVHAHAPQPAPAFQRARISWDHKFPGSVVPLRPALTAGNNPLVRARFARAQESVGLSRAVGRDRRIGALPSMTQQPWMFPAAAKTPQPAARVSAQLAPNLSLRAAGAIAPA